MQHTWVDLVDCGIFLALVTLLSAQVDLVSAVSDHVHLSHICLMRPANAWFGSSATIVIWSNGSRLSLVVFSFLRLYSYSIIFTCSLNPKLQSRFGALNDLVNSIQVIEPFQNGSSVGTRIGKQFFGSYDATNNTLLKFNHCKLI